MRYYFIQFFKLLFSTTLFWSGAFCLFITIRYFAIGAEEGIAITDFSFASRKEPEFMRHRLVQCQVCDLVFADSPPSQDTLSHLYHDANYDSDLEADDAARVYFGVIKKKIIFGLVEGS